MADAKITQLNELTTPALEDLLAIVDDPGGSPETKKVTICNLLSAITLPPQGGMLNGQIVVSVSANDLIVAIKGLDGNDPSATNPVYVRIGNSIRQITAALSKTLADGTNWFNAGGAELATRAVDYFVYLIWNTTPATDIVDLGFARIPYGRTYADFSTTTTNEKYLAYANGSAPTSTDECEVIGRFTATLSAGAGYTWSISGTGSVINRPIYETQSLNFTPSYSAASPMTYKSVTTNNASYQIKGDTISVQIASVGTTGGTTHREIWFTLPFTPNATVYDGSNHIGWGGNCYDTSWQHASFEWLPTSSVVRVMKQVEANWALAASKYIECGNIFYRL